VAHRVNFDHHSAANADRELGLGSRSLRIFISRPTVRLACVRPAPRRPEWEIPPTAERRPNRCVVNSQIAEATEKFCHGEIAPERLKRSGPNRLSVQCDHATAVGSSFFGLERRDFIPNHSVRYQTAPTFQWISRKSRVGDTHTIDATDGGWAIVTWPRSTTHSRENSCSLEGPFLTLGATVAMSCLEWDPARFIARRGRHPAALQIGCEPIRIAAIAANRRKRHGWNGISGNAAGSGCAG